MAITRRTFDSGTQSVSLTACPFCDAPIAEGDAWPDHWQYRCPENEANQ